MDAAAPVLRLGASALPEARSTAEVSSYRMYQVPVLSVTIGSAAVSVHHRSPTTTLVIVFVF